jgi:Fungal protein kinase
MMQSELCNATFESRSLLKKRCPAEEKAVKISLSKLKRGIFHDCSSQSLKEWPRRSEPERTHYAPFAWLLNEVLEVSREKLPQLNIHGHLQFFVYRQEMAEGVDIDSSLKPNIVGCKCLDVNAKEWWSWKEAEICVAVKNSWSDLILQASMYAHCMFAHQPQRLFVTVIHFNPSTMGVRFGFYSREGLTVTPELDLSEKAGFEGFIRGVVGIYSLIEQCRAGIDTTRTGTSFTIPNLGIHGISKTLCDRRCVRGRATRVYLLVKEGVSL